MDFRPTDERRMLSESLRRYLADQYSFEIRQSFAYGAPYHSRKVYSELADLGVLGAFLEGNKGGFGGSGFDITTVFEEIGRALCCEPILPTLLAIRLLTDTGNHEFLNDIVAGNVRPAVSIFEPEAGERLADLKTLASARSTGYDISGRKSVVYGAYGANMHLVVARCEEKLDLFVVDNPEVVDYAVIDGGGAAEVILVDTPAKRIAKDVTSALECALDAGRLALCAEAIGAMDVLLQMTIDYMKQRKQFGQSLSSFQALQHRTVDLVAELEQARSITILAAAKLNTPEAPRYTSMAKNLIGRTAIRFSEESIQLHGGIGLTWDYPGSHYAKRLAMIDHQLGDRLTHLTGLLTM